MLSKSNSQSNTFRSMPHLWMSSLVMFFMKSASFSALGAARSTPRCPVEMQKCLHSISYTMWSLSMLCITIWYPVRQCLSHACTPSMLYPEPLDPCPVLLPSYILNPCLSLLLLLLVLYCTCTQWCTLHSTYPAALQSHDAIPCQTISHNIRYMYDIKVRCQCIYSKPGKTNMEVRN